MFVSVLNFLIAPTDARMRVCVCGVRNGAPGEWFGDACMHTPHDCSALLAARSVFSFSLRAAADLSAAKNMPLPNVCPFFRRHAVRFFAFIHIKLRHTRKFY